MSRQDIVFQSDFFNGTGNTRNLKMRKQIKLADNKVSMSWDIPLSQSAKKFHFRFHGCLPGGLHLGDNK
jgi:hypothetical protein